MLKKPVIIHRMELTKEEDSNFHSVIESLEELEDELLSKNFEGFIIKGEQGTYYGELNEIRDCLDLLIKFKNSDEITLGGMNEN